MTTDNINTFKDLVSFVKEKTGITKPKKKLIFRSESEIFKFKLQIRNLKKIAIRRAAKNLEIK